MSEIVRYDPKEQPLDNEIKPIEPGFYLANNGRVATEFYQSGNEVVFVNKGRRISWTPNDMRYLDEFGMEDTIYTVQEVPLETKANYARYNRAMPDVDDWFIMENDRLKHQILIQGFQPDPSPWLFGNIDFAIGGKMKFDSDLKIFADGIEQLNPFETNGNIQLFDGDELVFVLPQIIAFDSAYDRAMTFGKYRVWFDDNGEMMFDIIVDNNWISSLERVYPIVIDPTVVVNSGYSTAGNGGRKGVELSNGWLVVGVNNTDFFYFFVSKDVGITWTQLCYAFNVNINTNDLSLTSKGTRVYAIFGETPDEVKLLNINALTVTNIDIYSTHTIIDSVQQAIGRVAAIINPSQTELHVVWVSKRMAYSLSFNVRYRKGIINPDFTITWSPVEQLSTRDSSNNNLNNPSIVINKDGYPVIFIDAKISSSSASIGRFSYNGTSWTTTTNLTDISVYEGVTYNQHSPSAIFIPQFVNSLPNGLMGVAWNGFDSVDTTTSYIRFSRSLDNNVSWESMQKLVPGQNASLSADKKGKLYIEYEDTGNRKRIESSNNGVSWSVPIVLGTGTNPNMLFDPTFNSGVIASVYMDASTVKFDLFTLNSPPNSPTGLTRSNFDVSESASFSWTFSDPDPSDSQSAYQLQIVDVETSAIALDSGKVASTQSLYTLIMNTLINGKQYQWRVRTWDNSDSQGSWSDYKTFYTSSKPTVAVTNISDGQIISTLPFTLEWSMSDPESEGQSAYQVKIMNQSNQVLSDTGKIMDSRSRMKTVTYDFLNETTYKVGLSVWDGKDVKSIEQVTSIDVNFIPPATPSITSSVDDDRGLINIHVTQPMNVPPQPPVVNTDIYRRKQGELSWTRIAVGIGDTFTDYTPMSGQVYEYKVRVYGDNQVYTDSDVISESVALKSSQLSLVTDYSKFVQLTFNPERNESNSRQLNIAQFAGREHPMAEFGENRNNTLSSNFTIKDKSILNLLRQLADSGQTLLYRDNRGRKMFCSVGGLQVTDERLLLYQVAFSMTNISYTEEV